jgi:hypothetical protein
MRVLLALLLVVHGAAHLVGFVVPWRLMTSADFLQVSATLGELTADGPIGARIVGVVWLLLALTFFVLAAGLLLHVQGIEQWTLGAVAVSTLLCVLDWPDARFGIAANVAVLLLLVALAPLSVLR